MGSPKPVETPADTENMGPIIMNRVLPERTSGITKPPKTVFNVGSEKTTDHASWPKVTLKTTWKSQALAFPLKNNTGSTSQVTI